jgi:hypothetical protein
METKEYLPRRKKTKTSRPKLVNLCTMNKEKQTSEVGDQTRLKQSVSTLLLPMFRNAFVLKSSFRDNGPEIRTSSLFITAKVKINHFSPVRLSSDRPKKNESDGQCASESEEVVLTTKV